MKNGVYGQSTTTPLCCFFLLTLFPCSSMVTSKGYSSYQKPAPTLAFSNPQYLQGISTCPGLGPLWAAVWICAPVCSSWAARNICSTMVFSTGCRVISALALGITLPDLDVYRIVSNVFIFLIAWSTLSFLKYIFPGASPLWQRGPDMPFGGATGAIWNCQCSAWCSPSITWQSPPLQPPAANTLPWSTNTCAKN